MRLTPAFEVSKHGKDECHRVYPAGAPGGGAGHLAEPQGNHGHDGDGLCHGICRGRLLFSGRSRAFRRRAARLWGRTLDFERSAMANRWYVIHVYSGFEKKVAASIREQAEQKGLSDVFEEILVPTEEVVEIKRGAKVSAERKFFPGYVLIKMDMSDETWHLVKNTAKVTGFLGGRGRAATIRDGRGCPHHAPGPRGDRATEALGHL